MPYVAALKINQIIEVEYIFDTEEDAAVMLKAMHEPGFVGSTGSRLSDISRKAVKAETDALLDALLVTPSTSTSSA